MEIHMRSEKFVRKPEISAVPPYNNTSVLKLKNKSRKNYNNHPCSLNRVRLFVSEIRERSTKIIHIYNNSKDMFPLHLALFL